MMTAIPYAEGRRAVVIHEDDVGMSHGANAAFAELSAMGACSAGSVMPPCPWFPEAVEMAQSQSVARSWRAPDPQQREEALSLAAVDQSAAIGGLDG